jgi:hypothetical protein
LERVRDPTPAPPLEGRGVATAGEVLGQRYSSDFSTIRVQRLFPNFPTIFHNLCPKILRQFEFMSVRVRC